MPWNPRVSCAVWMRAGRTPSRWSRRRFYATARVVVMHGRHAKSVVPEQEADLWSGVPCLDLGMQDEYRTAASEPPTWFGQLYRETAIRRIVAAEHTALIEREERDRLQERFADPAPKPWEPNVLSATPTLELGIDIGNLSNVVMCSVPPAPKNYQQRTGRAGRRDGNALTVTVATGQPHDLYFYAEPLDMLASRVDPPGVFLNASAVLERQLTAFCLDNWVADGVPEGAVPQRIRPVLDNVESARLRGFPYPFFDFVQRSSDDLLERFLAAFANDPDVRLLRLPDAVPAGRHRRAGAAHGSGSESPAGSGQRAQGNPRRGRGAAPAHRRAQARPARRSAGRRESRTSPASARGCKASSAA